MIAQLLREFASLFVVSDPFVRSPRTGAPAAAAPADRHLWVLAFIVAAGALLRFWGLGAVGLHGDEKTMALPVMNLVEHGLPLMPSGMFYPRALGQLYLMAASVLVFGQSEWALRFPSAVCGVLLIVLTWKAGQRFLTPRWNLALTAAVAFLPSFIEDAQTARMYVFLVTCVAGYMVLLFEWERSGRIGYLVAAVVTMVVGIQFHTLAIFAAFLVLVPGLLQGDARKFRAGAVAFAVMAVGFEVINTLIDHAYPHEVEADSGPVGNGPHAALVPHLGHLWLVVAAVPALVFALWVARPDARGPGGGAGGRGGRRRGRRRRR
jgi:Dolichyl-phosphate-mannose-protein mannosyltransferase